MKLILAVTVWAALSQAAVLQFESPTPMREAQKIENNHNLRIVNGFPAEQGQFPYQVFLRAFLLSGGSSACGGSLISEEWVLTAAHCIDRVDRLDVIMGTIAHATPEQNISSVECIIHPGYNRANLNNDIGLIRLESPVKFSPNIQPVALPSADRIDDLLLDVTATVSGFGRTSDAPGSGVSPIKNWVPIRIISNSDCQSVYGSSVIVPSTICGVGANELNQSTCNGDSGGPLTIQENGTSLQIGVVSFVSSRGCASGNPSGYVRTTHFRSWIHEVTKV